LPLAVRAGNRPRQRKSKKTVTGDILKKLLTVCACVRLVDVRDRADGHNTPALSKDSSRLHQDHVWRRRQRTCHSDRSTDDRSETLADRGGLLWQCIASMDGRRSGMTDRPSRPRTFSKSHPSVALV
jgi:hypothetical protein